VFELYLAERCPFCVKVRQYLEDIGVAYVAKPIPLGGGGSPLRDELLRLGGKLQVPFLVDPERGVKMYESDDIIAYVKQSYAQGTPRPAR